MVVQHNIPALNSHRNLGVNNSAVSKNLEKLSSGYRINRAGDDAAGLAISEKMRSQIRGLGMAEQNTSNAISLIQTAEGGLNETHAILQRMRELSVQASNGTYDQQDREYLQLEVKELLAEIDRIADSTHYNNIYVLNGQGLASGGGGGGLTLPSFQLPTTAISMSGSGLGNGVVDSTTTFKIDLTFDGSGDVTSIALNGSIGGTAGATGVSNIAYDDATGKITFDVTDGGNTQSYELTIDKTAAGNAASGDVLTVSFKGTATADELVVDSATSGFAPVGGGGGGGGNPVITFQVGANNKTFEQVNLTIASMKAADLAQGLENINIDSQTGARAAMDLIDEAIITVSEQRAQFGAMQNRLEHTLNNLGVAKENLTAAESTIRDVDMAKEMMEFTQNSILVQAAQAMLAQANQLPQGVLQLLR